MDSYIPFETALMFLVTAYLLSVILLLVVADVAIATLEIEYSLFNKPKQIKPWCL